MAGEAHAWPMLRRLLLIALLLAMPLSGCIENEAAPPLARGADDAGDESPAIAFAPSNAFLADAPRPPGASVSGGAEPSILVDKDGAFILIGDTSGVYRSVDDGATWQRVSVPRIGGAFNDGWALAQDDAGRVYASTTNGQLIGVAISDDGGATWRASTQQAVAVAGVADRPWLAARGDGEVALLYYGAPSGELCARSLDAGETWLDRSVGWSAPNAGNAAFDSQGDLYYSNGDQVYRFALACRSAPSARPLPASGAQIFTQVAIDAEDRVYAAQPTANNGAMTLRGFSAWSTKSYKEVVVSPPDLRSNTFATLSAHGNEVVVAWYGSETSGNPASAAFDGAWNVFVARIIGFWTDSPTIHYARLTNEANHVGDFCMGGISCTEGDRDLLDYFMVDHAPDGTVHVAYGHDGTTSRPEVRYAHIATFG